MKIIKTNLSIVNDKILDHQSYVEEEENWEAFIDKAKTGYLFSKNRQVAVNNITYDDYHLSCDVHNESGAYTKHLAYIEGRVLITK